MKWFRKYPEIVLSELFKGYRLERYLNLKEDDYPVNSSNFKGANFEAFQKRLMGKEFGNGSSIPQFLRDTLDELIVLELDEDCPVCGQPGLGIYFDTVNKEIAFECRQCGFARHVDWFAVPDGSLTFATNDALLEAKIEVVEVQGWKYAVNREA